MNRQNEIEVIKTQPLHREDLAAQPMAQFARWYRQAQDAGLQQPHAMSLATADRNGRVSSRLVLMRSFDERGFLFFTGLETGKVQQIIQNPQVALLFPWLLLERQVRVEGEATRLPRSETLRYFLSRPRASQLGAWFTQEGGAVASRSLLQKQWHTIKERFRQGQVPLPDAWGGYRVQPHLVEFWQGRSDGLHERFVYTRQRESKWQIRRLRP